MSGSLTQVKGFVQSEMLLLAPRIAYTPEQVDLGQYTFLPWVRNGMAAQLTAPAAGQLRASSLVSFNVEDDKGGTAPVSKLLTLRGPSDVLGVDAAQIIWRYPQPNSSNAEETYVAHIEFDLPELPWLFTPTVPQGDRLAPWMVLVVVEQRFFRIDQGPPGLPWRLTTRLGELQPLDDSWACAHAQVQGAPNAPGANVDDRLTSAHGPQNLSRILCPRKLDSNKSYVACLVPAFDCGVRAGLGLSGGTLAAAWTRGNGDDATEITLPVYDQWRFSMAGAGDFESLARKLKGLPAPWQIGRRVIDFATPRGGMTALAANESGRVQVFQCALTSPAAPPAGLDKGPWTDAKRNELRELAIDGDKIAGGGRAVPDLPRVNPRLYARFQRAQSRITELNDGDWFPQLNTTAPHRVAAGLGTRVVRKDQEQLMQSAWAQVGEIDKANRQLAQAQFARFAGERLHLNHFSKLALGDLAQVTRGVQRKLRLGGDALTVSGNATRSFTAPAALSSAFRRATRLRGPLARFLGGNGAVLVRSMVASADRFQDFRRTYSEPDGIAALSATTLNRFAPESVARVLGVPVANALATLQTRSAQLARPTVADQILQPVATWRTRGAVIDFGQVGATRLLDLVEATLPTQKTSARFEALTGIVGGLKLSGIAAVQTQVDRISQRAGLQFTSATVPAVASNQSTTTTATLPAGSILQQPRPLVTGPRAGLSVQLNQPQLAVVTPAASAVTVQAISNIRFNATGVSASAQVATLVGDFTAAIGSVALPLTPELPPFTAARSSILLELDPKTTVTKYMVARLGTIPSWMAVDWFSDGFVQPIMQAPIFNRPMFEALDSYDRDWLVPGLGEIHETDFVTLLQTNPVFIEAFLAGLSDEMGRELLWRGFPTDCRGTYFKRFWNARLDELATPIHQFTRTPLGSHISAQAGGAAGRLVMLVRGEVVRRYPNAMLFALRQIGTDADQRPTFAELPASGQPGSILFHVPLKPDILLTGFLLTADEVKNADTGTNPWWFFIGEHPTAPRFGLDLPVTPNVIGTIKRDQATWGSFGPLRQDRFLNTSGSSVIVTEPVSVETTPWNAAALHGAAVARVLLQDPFRAAFRGWKLIAPAR